ncbi:hypothetical protein N665_0157s0155 [Sinapis alba]|nr:hypothetical protein N665_0157s0155 [Sinapis alba]
MTSGERSNELYREINVQFPTHHHVNNIPQPSYIFQQHNNTNLNLMTQRVSPPGNQYDNGVVPITNLVTTHQTHMPSHQISEFPGNDENIEERLVYNEDEEEDDGVKNLLTSWFPEQINLFPLEESVIATTMRFNDIHVSDNQQQPVYVHEPSMVHIPLLPSSLTHNPFLDQVTTAYIS